MKFPAENVYLSMDALADQLLAKKIPLTSKQNVVYVANDNLIAAYVSGTNLERIKRNISSPLSLSEFDGLLKIEIEADEVFYPWDLIQNNGLQIVKDFESLIKRTGKNSR